MSGISHKVRSTLPPFSQPRSIAMSGISQKVRSPLTHLCQPRSIAMSGISQKVRSLFWGYGKVSRS
ncbi:hypothetical protein [Microcoleus sp.]|uniref:hypothetical protein n=1 Tax=Microcoleus sp. TaxID=44472 RepID=UPI00359490FE